LNKVGKVLRHLERAKIDEFVSRVQLCVTTIKGNKG
jgi:hypothetical protein